MGRTDHAGRRSACAALLLASAVASMATGCQTRCQNSFDCGETGVCREGRCEIECYTDSDCQAPPDCQARPWACAPKLRCSSLGTCEVPYATPTPDLAPAPNGEADDSGRGFDDPPGSGPSFVIDALAVASLDQGLNLDSGSPTDAGEDNQLWRLGQLGNAQIQAGLEAGESLVLVELAGLDEDYAGNQDNLTVKIYGGRDADEPFFPSNNFRPQPGSSRCCEFKISPSSLQGIPPRATARAPAKIELGRLRMLAPVSMRLALSIGAPPHEDLRLENVLLDARVPPDLDEISDGRLGGVIPARELAEHRNPYCGARPELCPQGLGVSSLLDLVRQFEPQPRFDLDGDGLECLFDGDGDGVIELCCDGIGTYDTCERIGANGCPGLTAPPVIAGQPSSCVDAPGVADGYSFTLLFHAVPASIIGFAQ